jgi:hypothetical protein
MSTRGNKLYIFSANTQTKLTQTKFSIDIYTSLYFIFYFISFFMMPIGFTISNHTKLMGVGRVGEGKGGGGEGADDDVEEGVRDILALGLRLGERGGRGGDERGGEGGLVRVGQELLLTTLLPRCQVCHSIIVITSATTISRSPPRHLLPLHPSSFPCPYPSCLLLPLSSLPSPYLLHT